MKTRLVRSELGIDARTGRIDQACARYGVERNTMRQIAEVEPYTLKKCL